MSSTIDLCEKYFGSKNIYEVFALKKDCTDKEIKKAYYRLSLKNHPDRVPEEDKKEATEKFKLLSRLHNILNDKSKKALYDERGIIDDDDDNNLSTWLDLWKSIFQPITDEDIDNYKKEYIGSEIERNDIKKAYLNGKGCINFLMNSVAFMGVEDEPRIQEIVKKMIDSGEVPEYKIFTNEPKAKRIRRHKKYAREEVEAQNIKKKLSSEGNLEQQIMKNAKNRESSFNSLLDNLISKYGNDEDEVIPVKKSKIKVSSKKQSLKQKNEVKSGRVTRNSTK